MNENQKNHHLISRDLYIVLYAAKQVLLENTSYGTFKAILKMYEDELKKLKRPEDEIWKNYWETGKSKIKEN